MSGTSSAGAASSGSEPVSSGVVSGGAVSSGAVTSGATPVVSGGGVSSAVSTDPTVGSGLSGFVYMTRAPIAGVPEWTIIKNGAVIEQMIANGQIGQCTRFAAAAFMGAGEN